MTAAPTAAPAGEYSTVDLALVCVGRPLFAPIFDVRNVLLLAEGQTVTDAFLERLRDREIRSVRAHGRDVVCVAGSEWSSFLPPQGTATAARPDRAGCFSDSRNQTSDRLDAEIGLGRLRLPPQKEPYLAQVRQPGGRLYDSAARRRVIETYNKSTDRLRCVYDRLAAGESVERVNLDEIAEQTLSDLAGDIDLFSCVSCNPLPGDYPVRHSVNVAMLALAVGVRLELDLPTLRELVIGCLVHDAGMLWIDRDVYDHPETLDPARFLEITKHPILVFEVLKDSGLIPKRSAFIAYQMHERCDGSGYPRRRTAEQIHFLSRVAAVADAYVALVSPRAHRPALMPYSAMENLLRDANRGLYDQAAVRGLLRALSLFPIGSCAELSDGRRVKILRAGDDYCRPTVTVCGSDGSEIIDLATIPELAVVRAVPASVN